MKVLALVVLVIAVSGLEAGVVKREVPNLDQISQLLQSWADTLKTSTQEWVAKLQNGEVQAQAGEYLEQTKAHVEPIKTQLEKLFGDLIEAGKNAIKN